MTARRATSYVCLTFRPHLEERGERERGERVPLDGGRLLRHPGLRTRRLMVAGRRDCDSGVMPCRREGREREREEGERRNVVWPKCGRPAGSIRRYESSPVGRRSVERERATETVGRSVGSDFCPQWPLSLSLSLSLSIYFLAHSLSFPLPPSLFLFSWCLHCPFYLLSLLLLLSFSHFSLSLPLSYPYLSRTPH